MKIQVAFNLPTKDFKSTEHKTLPVEVCLTEGEVVNGDIEYKVSIPDYMFNELADSEPKYKTVYDINNREVSGLFPSTTYSKKFQKTQTSTRISSLQDYINGLSQVLTDRYSLETETMKKKLFIYFNHNQAHATNNLNGAYVGEEVKQVFRFFTGYEVMTDKYSNNLFNTKVEKKYFTKIFYAHPNSSLRKQDTGFREDNKVFLPLPSLNQSTKDFENTYSIIDWTEEREEFCNRIKETFIKVNNELSEFLKNISEEKMDKLMSNNTLKFIQ